MTRLFGCLLWAVLVAVPACSATPPVGGPTPVSSPIPHRYGAPDVGAPRDVRPFVASPCSLLTTAQLRDLGLAAEGRQRTIITNEQECSWGSGTVEQALGIILVPDRDALADSYRTPPLAIFEPTTVGDLPAVQERTGPTSISCTVTVGTDESQGFVLNYYVYGVAAGEVPDEDACVRARRIAEQVVVNLPPLVKG